jgi:hypothetical protein
MTLHGWVRHSCLTFLTGKNACPTEGEFQIETHPEGKERVVCY